MKKIFLDLLKQPITNSYLDKIDKKTFIILKFLMIL